MSEYRTLDHAADLMIEAWGAHLEDAFGAAAKAVAEVSGTQGNGAVNQVVVNVRSADLEGLLVEWLNEIVYLIFAEDAHLVSIWVNCIQREDQEWSCRATLQFTKQLFRTRDIKAVTWHSARVEISDKIVVRFVLDV